ncbi:amidase signature domain-containing protein [Dendryphion nanum]|uniref:Amidase signature domain-containing protein n=1 Tax=Dendryphion nanum TaxID=256645 RepID=A0A9P9EHV3_9PLEO|nr:amidase signature domain-containing protein [Dendryphion nanum]
MSVVFLSTGPPTVPPGTLQALAETYNILIPPRDLPSYLHLLNGLHASATLLSSFPSYTDPRLLPEPTTLPRTCTKKGGIAETNPLNAWSHYTTISFPSPVTQTLAGKTAAVKDNVAIAGIPLTGGTFPELLTGTSEYPIPDIDAVVVQRILAAGAILKGSANCEHFSMSPLSYTSATGPVHNPWVHGYTTGGSSSGCGAVVGASQVRAWRARHKLSPLSDEVLGEGVDMAIGGDQGGSIRIPAAYAGVYGLKPTHGLVPYTGILGLVPMIDHAGPMTMSLEDNMVLLGVLAGWDGIDPRSTPETPLRGNVVNYKRMVEKWIEEKKQIREWTAKNAGKGLRVGVIKESLEVLGLTKEVKRVFGEAVEQFKAVGADVQEISIPMHTLGPSIWTLATRPFIPTHGLQNRASPLLHYPMPEVTPPPLDQKTFDALNKHNPAVANMYLNAAFLEQRDDANRLLAKSMTHIQQLRDAYDVVLRDFDVLLTPVNPRVGSKHPTYDMTAGEKMDPAIGAPLNTCAFNVTGHPGLSMPAGWGRLPDGAGRLPVGMQLVAKRFDEQSIYKAATAWEVGGLGLDRWNGQP